MSVGVFILVAGAAAGALVLLHGFAAAKRDSGQMLEAYGEMLTAAREARLRALENPETEDGKQDAPDAEAAVAAQVQADTLSSIATQAPPPGG